MLDKKLYLALSSPVQKAIFYMLKPTELEGVELYCHQLTYPAKLIRCVQLT